MAIAETENGVGVVAGTAVGFEIGVALGAILIAGGQNVDATVVFGVALGAGDVFRGDVMVDGAVMATEAGRVFGFFGEGVGGFYMASGAVVGEDSVSFGHFAAAVDASVFGDDQPDDPGESQSGHEDAESQFGGLQRSRPFEIVQVDALSEFFSCACAC